MEGRLQVVSNAATAANALQWSVGAATIEHDFHHVLLGTLLTYEDCELQHVDLFKQLLKEEFLPNDACLNLLDRTEPPHALSCLNYKAVEVPKTEIMSNHALKETSDVINIQLPKSIVTKLIGKGGCHIEKIRRKSKATVTIYDANTKRDADIKKATHTKRNTEIEKATSNPLLQTLSIQGPAADVHHTLAHITNELYRLSYELLR